VLGIALVDQRKVMFSYVYLCWTFAARLTRGSLVSLTFCLVSLCTIKCGSAAVFSLALCLFVAVLSDVAVSKKWGVAVLAWVCAGLQEDGGDCIYRIAIIEG
jgi:hypothetical protein